MALEQGASPLDSGVVVQLAQRLLCVNEGAERQQLSQQLLESLASLQEVTDLSVDDPERVRVLLQDVGAVVERAFLLSSAIGAERYFLGRVIRTTTAYKGKVHSEARGTQKYDKPKLNEQLRYTHVLDGVELVIKQEQQAVTATPAIAKLDLDRPDKLDRSQLAPILGRLGIVPECLECRSGVYISKKFSEDGIDYINRQRKAGVSTEFFLHFLAGVAQPVAQLHAQSLVHHDLKLENVVFQLGENRQIRDIKLIDLDSIRFLREQQSAILILRVVIDLQDELKRPLIHDGKVLQDICRRYAIQVQELQERLHLDPPGDLHDNEQELYHIKCALNSEPLNMLSALYDTLIDAQKHNDGDISLEGMQSACKALCSWVINILNVTHTRRDASPELDAFIQTVKKLLQGEYVDFADNLDLRTQDVWSLGVMVLLALQPALVRTLDSKSHHSNRIKAIRNAVQQLLDNPQVINFPAALTLVTCLDHLLRENPQERWTMPQLLDALAAHDERVLCAQVGALGMQSVNDSA